MKKEILLRNFNEFLDIETNAINKLSLFFQMQKDSYCQTNIEILKARGIDEATAIIKTRQSWVTAIGGALEGIIELYLKRFCDENGLKFTNDKILKRQKLSPELDSVKRNLLVHFNSHSVLPDADIVIYSFKETAKILAILSVKNSFRERYTETPYWKLKLKSNPNTKDIKVYMITPDNDDEISFSSSARGIRKARIVMEYELDGIFLAKDEFEGSQKVKNISEIFSVLKAIL